ncbi:MAG: tetratricopeptide repeat protein [Bacteroidia bacterium]|nr:tetratricopeptide repeat protein [Bacteroidia bacterium]
MKKLTLTLFYGILSLCLVFAKTGKEAFLVGKDTYDSGKYQEAISLFQESITLEPQHYTAKGSYMIALCYKKMNQCDQAKTYFITAWKHSPTDGGASSKAKFQEQVERCNLSFQEITGQTETKTTTTTPTNIPNNTSPNPAPESSSSSWVIIGIVISIAVLVIWFLRKKNIESQKAITTQEDIQTQLDLKEIYHTAFDDQLWQKLAQQYEPNMVNQTQISWQLNYNSLQTDPNPQSVQDLLMKVRQLKRDPDMIFKEID